MAQQSKGKGKFPAARSITLVGNLAGKPREIDGKDDTRGAGFTVAVNSRDFRGLEAVEYVDCTIWGFWAGAVLGGEYDDNPRVSVVGDLYWSEHTGGKYEGERKIILEALEISKVIYPPDDEEGRPARRRRRDEDDDEERTSERPRSRRRRDDDDEDDERPRRRSRARDDEDEDEDEAPRRSRARSRDDEDEDERPVRSRARRARNDGDDIDD